MLRRVAPRLATAALLLCLGGCKVSVRVGVDANDRGAGEVEATVTLDAAAQRYAGDLRGQLRVDDLTDGGWKVVGPTKLSNGDVRVTATKTLAKPSQLEAIMRELDGGQGLFGGVALRQTRSFFKTDSRFRATVDLRQGIEAFSDDELREQLGPAFGATEGGYSERIGTAVADAIPITVGVRLPGDVSSNSAQSSGGTAAWHPRLGEQVQLAASATHWNVRGVGLAALSVFAGGLGVVSAWRLRRRPTTQQ